MTGATGFIGRNLCARLLREGHDVTAAARDVESIRRRFPAARPVRIDMNRMSTPSDWAPLLADIDAVVNCAGILQSGPGQSAGAVHAAAPIALFDACAAHGVRRVVQISAVSADEEAGTEYALTKKAADDHLRSLDLDWVVLRPSLVYGPGSYGGTSTIRGLAGLPFVIPLIGDGGKRFQPIYIDDLAETVSRCLADTALAHHTLDPVGPETLTLRRIIELTRTWLDLPPARFLPVPMVLVRAAARIGDRLGRGTLRTTALDQMAYGNVSDPAAFEAAIGFRPRSMAEAFEQAPSHVQDRWQARLQFLRPVLTAALAALWIGSGIAGFLVPPLRLAPMLAARGIPHAASTIMIAGLSAFDIVIGIALVIGWSWRWFGLLQIVLVAVYTVALGVLMPALWTDPFGPLLKNLPVLAAIAAWAALRDDR